MARTKFPVEVLTPEGEVFNGEVEMLSTRTQVGEVGVLAHHSPLLATLDPADLRLHLSESEVKHFAQAEGYLQVYGNHALVLVEECIEPDEVDREAMRETLRKAEEVLGRIDREAVLKRVRDAGTSSEREEARQLTAEYEHAVADRKRAEVFLQLAGESA